MSRRAFRILRISTLILAGWSASGQLLAQQPYAVVAQWKIGGDSRWDYVHIDSATQRLYVSHGSRVEVLDARTGQIIGSIDGLQGVHGIAIDGQGKHGFISDSAGGIVVFDARTLAKVKSIPTEFGPDGIVYEPQTHTVWTFNGRPGNANATAVDANTLEQVATIPLTKERLEAQTTDGKGHVFGNLGGVIARIDSRGRRIDAQWETGCESGSGLAYDARKNRIFQACRGNKLYVVDATNGKVLGAGEIGDRPDGAGYSDKFGVAFASTGDGFLSVIDANAPGYPVLQKVATRNGARTMDYDPKTDRVFTISAERDPNVQLPSGPPGPPVPGQAPISPYKPDSFGVVVVGRH